MQECEQSRVGIVGTAHGLVRQDERRQGFRKVRRSRLHAALAVARRFRPGVGVERGLAESRAGPEAGAGQFMRIRLLHRSEEHTSELQSLMRISYAVFCLKKKNQQTTNTSTTTYKSITLIYSLYSIPNQHTPL